jgi:tyrosine-protein kinase Etk/Wzc
MMELVEGNAGTERRRAAMLQREIHLKDLWAVVVRHWKLVVALSALVAGGAWYSGRGTIPSFQSRLTVQVSSAKQVFARTDDIDIDELALKTDPIRSEILIVGTQALALRVVRALDLNLEIAEPQVYRGALLAGITVDDTTPPGNFVLEVLDDGGAKVLEPAGALVAAAGPGELLAGPGFSFTVLPQAGPRSVRFRIVRDVDAAAWVTGGLSYQIREQTNAVDIWFTATDPTLVPYVLNQAAVELSEDGAERGRQAASARRRYIEDQVARTAAASQQKFLELQRFKENRRITDLSSEESSLISSIRDLELERQRIRIQIATLTDAMPSADSVGGIEGLNRLAAVEGTSSNPALQFQINNLLQLYDERRSLTAGATGLSEGNPQVRGIDQRLRQAHAALSAAVGATLQSLRRREQALGTKVEELRGTLMSFPGMETQIAQLQLESSIEEDMHRYLLGQLEQARMQENTIIPYVKILDGASPPVRIGTNLKQKIILGFLVGLLLGLGGAFFLEYLDQTIKSATDIERAVGTPVLGLIPHEPKLAAGANGRRGKPIVVLSALSPDNPAVEAYRALRTNVTFVGAEKQLQLIAVTSPGPGEGKSTTAANLAMTLAQGGNRTLLMDGDMRRPLQHRAFGLVQEPGLTDVLVGTATAREAVRPDVAENLDILPSGAQPPNPSELLGSDAMHRLVTDLRHEYDYVVVDTPPVLPVTDATIVATVADGTILVMKSGETEETAAQRAVEQLRRVRARIAGAVLNGITPRHDHYYTYYSYRREPGTRSRKGGRRLLSRLASMV